MEDTLQIILSEIKGLRTEMNQRFEEQEKNFDEKLFALEQRMDARFDKKLLSLEQKMDAKFEEQEKKFDEKLFKLEENFDERLMIMEDNFDDKLKSLEGRFDQRLLEMEERFDNKLDTRFAEQEKNFDEKLSDFSKDVAMEFVNIIASIDKKQTKDSNDLSSRIQITNQTALQRYIDTEYRLSKVEEKQKRTQESQADMKSELVQQRKLIDSILKQIQKVG